MLLRAASLSAPLIASTVLLAACAGAPGVSGAADAGGCRTLFLASGAEGQVAPTRVCPPALDAQSAGPLAVSPAAAATADPGRSEPYASAAAMIENADMAAFMARVRSDFAQGENAGAWGYAVVDALAAGDADLARRVLQAMEAEADLPQMSADHLRPWALAAAGDAQGARAAIEALEQSLATLTVLGHRALLVTRHRLEPHLQHIPLEGRHD